VFGGTLMLFMGTQMKLPPSTTLDIVLVHVMIMLLAYIKVVEMQLIHLTILLKCARARISMIIIRFGQAF